MVWRSIYLYVVLGMFLVSTAVISSPQHAAATTSGANFTQIILNSSGAGSIRKSIPATGDLNGNDYKEIVVGALDGMLYVIAYNGSSWQKVWQRQTAVDINNALLPSDPVFSDGIIEASAAVADIDNDGDLEIIVATGGRPNSVTPSLNRHGAIIVYERTGTWSFTVKSGWPILMPDTTGSGAASNMPDGVRDGILATPTAGDIDGDGDLEIISITYDRAIRAYHHDGAVVTGWPIQRSSGDPILRGGESSAAIGDIDNDGLNEVVIGTFSPPWNGDNGEGPFPAIYNNPNYSLATLWAINGDSTLVDGFPVITEQVVKSSPALGDIDGDGDLEIVVGTGDFGGYVNGHQVYAWHGDGTPVSGWPQPTGGNMLSSPALADLNEDGVLDVIIGCGSDSDFSCKTLYAWGGNGANIPGFPVTINKPLQNPPVVGDIDGDNKLEILLTSNTSFDIMVFQHNGGSVDYSRSVPYQLWASPTIADLDNDGKIEIVAASGTSGGQSPTLFIFEEPGRIENAPWPQVQQNSARMGVLQAPILGFGEEIIVFHQAGTGNLVQLMQEVQNTGGGELAWTLNLSGTGGDVSADLMTGSLTAGDSTAVTFTIDLTGYSSGTMHNLGNLTIVASSSGLPVVNAPLSIPVKVYIGDISTNYIPFMNK